jgi:hypothetical protein
MSNIIEVGENCVKRIIKSTTIFTDASTPSNNYNYIPRDRNQYSDDDNEYYEDEDEDEYSEDNYDYNSHGVTTTFAQYYNTCNNNNEEEEEISLQHEIVKNKEEIDEKTMTMKPNVKPLPDLYNSERADIFEYYDSLVMFQNDGLMDLTTQVYSASSNNVTQTKNIITSLISGNTGCGKTDAAVITRSLFQMNPGQVNENHYIEFKFGNFKDKSNHNQIAGASSGYVGFGTTCLSDKLIDAKNFNRIQKEKLTGHEIKDQKEIESLYPKIIYIFIDELDKAEYSIMDTLNSLLDQGYLKGGNGKEFHLPTQTTLFICCTANFGSETLIQNPHLNYSEAKELIELDMISKGYKDWDIARLGTIIPFFPINETNAKLILKEKLKVFLTENIIKYQPFTNECFIMNDEDQDALVNHCMEKEYTFRAGLRKVVRLLKNELNSSGKLQRFHLEKYVDKKRSLPLMPPPQLKFKSIKFSDTLNTESLRNENPEIKAALDDRFNELTIERCLKSRSSIEYLSLSHDAMLKSCINVLGPIITINFNTHIHTSTDPLLLNKFEKVIKENSTLKRKIDDIHEIILSNPKERTRKKLKKISDCIKKDTSSDDSEHEYSQQQQQQQRKSICHSKNNTNSVNKSKMVIMPLLKEIQKENDNDNYDDDDNEEEEEEEEEDEVKMIDDDDEERIIYCQSCLCHKPKKMFVERWTKMVKGIPKTYHCFHEDKCNSCRKNSCRNKVIML